MLVPIPTKKKNCNQSQNQSHEFFKSLKLHNISGLMLCGYLDSNVKPNNSTFEYQKN
jgi:hypothetical protein